MKKISKLFLCLTLMLVSCFAMVGCKNNPQSENKWTTITIDNTNISSYFDLDGYLAYSFNNATGNIGDLWADNYYSMGSGVYYLEDALTSTPEYNLSNNKTLNLEDFTTLKSDPTENCLKWKAVILKAKDEIIIDWFKIRTYFLNNVSNSARTQVGLQFKICENYANSSLNEINTYQLTAGMPNQSFGLGVNGENDIDNYYNNLALYQDYYGTEINEWNYREIKLTKGQLFCIEFTGIEQIVPTYKGFKSFEEIELQANLDFVIENITMTVKVKS